MKMRKILLAVLVFVLMGYAAYVSFQPDISLRGARVQGEVRKVPMQWTVLGRTVNASVVPPDALSADLRPFMVAPESELEVRFTRKPSFAFAEMWNASEPFSFTEGTLRVPKAKGVFAYSITGEWRQGRVVYVFKVEVE